MNEEKNVGGGLAVAIFFFPHIFGWIVLRKGYAFGAKLLVLFYMLVSILPLYILASLIWMSQAPGFSENFARNRKLADRNAMMAKDYIDDYSEGSLDSEDSKNKDASQKGVKSIKITAVQLAREAEKGPKTLSAFKDKRLVITGRVTGAGGTNILYMAGTETYPALTLRYPSGIPGVASGVDYVATCTGIGIGIAGPDMKECR